MYRDLSHACREYRATLNAPANGWGQHVHAIYGRSDHMLRAMNAKWGAETVSNELDFQYANARFTREHDNGK